MIVLSLLVFGSFSPVFFIYTVEYTYSPIYNASLATVNLSKLNFAHDKIISKMYHTFGVVYPLIFCIIMITTSTIIVYHLRKSAENFDKGQSSKSSVSRINAGRSVQVSNKNMISKEIQVTKMLLVVIFVYIMDFFPRLCKYTASLFHPEIFPYRTNHNLNMLMAHLIWVLDFLNASINFFILMRMSSIFKKTFYEIFPRCHLTKKGKAVATQGLQPVKVA
ncbi:hypothetical protein ElyMa_001067500 [Elysia marginata]|uniref:G-protein coupled receptors family 1 profile domain-containing protein n=1 Tax=Elysia marginata TaxID=1093978 RepID=A0AAV4HRR2_9GAST|nr:hypothetical protein ElyMa_001067500 [Elysia marginata]